MSYKEIAIIAFAVLVLLLYMQPPTSQSKPAQCKESAANGAWDVISGDKEKELFVHTTGNDTACALNMTETCFSIDGALAAVRINRENDDFWTIYVNPDVYVSEDAVVLPCNIEIISTGDCHFVWITQNVSVEQTPQEICRIAMKKIRWENKGVSEITHETTDFLRFFLFNATVQGGILILRGVPETFIFESEVVLLTEVELILLNVSNVSGKHLTVDNSVVTMNQTLYVHFPELDFLNSLLLVNNNGSHVFLDFSSSEFWSSFIVIESCHCVSLVAPMTDITTVIENSCLKQIHDIRFHVDHIGLGYVPTNANDWMSPGEATNVKNVVHWMPELEDTE